MRSSQVASPGFDAMAFEVWPCLAAGGALLEYIEGKKLPSIRAIKDTYSVDDYNFYHKRALMRVDFNVPLDANFNITDDTRIVTAIPTIRKVLADGGSVVMRGGWLTLGSLTWTENVWLPRPPRPSRASIRKLCVPT